MALATGIGLAAGGAAYVLIRLIGLLTSIALFGEWQWGSLPSLVTLDASPAASHRRGRRGLHRGRDGDRGLFRTERAFRSLPLPVFWHPAIGALAAVLVAKTVSWWIALASGTSGRTGCPSAGR